MLADSIELQLSTSTPIDDLKEMLTEMDTDIFNQQTAADEAHGAFQDNCATVSHNYEVAIAENNFLIETHTANLVQYNGEL